MSTQLSEGEKKFFDSKGTDASGVALPASTPGNAESASGTPAPEPIPVSSEHPPVEPASAPGEGVPPAAAPAAAVPKAPEPEKYAPLKALQETRNENRQLREQLVQFNQWAQQVNQNLASIAPRDQAQPLPDREQDPLGYTLAAVDALNRQYAGLQQYRSQVEANSQQQQALNTVVGWGRQQAADYGKTQTGYVDATKFLMQNFSDELADRGYSSQQIAQVLAQEEVNIYRDAYASGKNPGEIVMALAQRRGFKTNGAQAASNPTVAAMQKIVAGQAAAGGLQGASAAPAAKRTAQDLASMAVNPRDKKSVEEWNRQWREVMGGR